MLGLFKKILSKSQAAPPPPAVPARPAPLARPPLPRPRVAAPAAAVSAPAPSPVHVPQMVPKQSAAIAPEPVPAPAPVPTALPPSNGTHVHICLATIAANVPESISHKVPANADQFVAIPVELVLPQLSRGQVVLTAAELCECSPEFFGALSGHNDVQVALPIADIVKQISPEQFVRRSQRRVEVPTDITSVFAPGGQGVSVAQPAAPAAPSAPAYRAQPAVTTTSAQPAPAASNPASRISMSPQAMAALKAATAAPAPARPAAPPPRAITPVAPAPAPLSRPAAAPVPKKAFPAIAKPTGHLAVPLASVCPEWDQEVRKQLVDVDVAQHQILVPLELLEPAMKSGKVLFSWAEVAAWIQPPLVIPPTPKVGEMPVELPLRVLAPLFMASQRSATQKRVSIDESIPDLFGGENGNGNGSSSAQIQSAPRAPQPAPAPAAPVAPARAVTPVSAPAPAPMRAVSAPLPKIEPTTVSAPAAAPDKTSLEEIIGSIGSRLGAKEIVANTARLPGVTGTLLAMTDGLLVTSNTPPTVKAETIAAFLPQMFGRMNQYTKELALGPLQQLTLGVEDGQWHVIKCPNIYFAVLGKHGEALPLNLLSQVAAELSSQSN